jgi:hypothetical protein
VRWPSHGRFGNSDRGAGRIVEAASLAVSFLSLAVHIRVLVDNDLGNHDAAGEVEGLRLGLDVNASERREIPKITNGHK